MEEQKRSTLDYTMHYGALLGMFWVFKYCFFIGQTYWIHFIYFFHLLNVVSPLLMYVFYLKYKSETQNQVHNIGKCILFVVAISFFGSLFESVIIYAHYAFIDPDLFANLSSKYVGAIENMPAPANFDAEKIVAFDEAKGIVGEWFSGKLIYIILNVFNQVFLGLMFSPLIGLLTRNRTSK